MRQYPKTFFALFSYAGLNEHTHESVLHEIFYANHNQCHLNYSRISGDALIERSRSRALGSFLKSDCDVCVMIDHDITWRPGDVCELSRVAHEKQALVGGLYCKRAIGQGWASRIKESTKVEFGADTDDVIECDGLATGFMAIPRSIVVDMVDRLNVDGPKFKAEVEAAAGDHEKLQRLYNLSIGFVRDGAYRKADFEYYDFFRCFRRRVQNLNQHEFLSEDWSFSERAAHCGYKTYISQRPILSHHGEYAFQIQDGMDATDRQRAAELAAAEAQNSNAGVPNGENQDPIAA